MNLSKAQTLCIYELLKAIIISENKIFILIPFKIVLPSLKNLNNSQKLTIISLIPSLR